MQSIKKKVIDVIDNLPEDATYNDIFEAIFFQQKVENGIQQIKEGKGISHEEVRERFKKWLE